MTSRKYLSSTNVYNDPAQFERCREVAQAYSNLSRKTYAIIRLTRRDAIVEHNGIKHQLPRYDWKDIADITTVSNLVAIVQPCAH